MKTDIYPCLDYVTLVSQYEDRLTSMERGFQMDHDFLDLWVPDENHNKSLYYLFESAALRNQKGLSLVLTPEVIASIDGAGLVESLKGLGSVSIETTPEKSVVTMDFVNKSSSATQSLDEIPGLSNIHRTYRDKLVRNTRTLLKQVDANEKANLEIPFNGGKVLVQVSPVTGLVEKFSYTGMPNNIQARMLEYLARQSEGLTIQEVSEHGVIRLENELRDPSLPLPVRGIVTPETAGPVFAELNKVVRQLFRMAREKLGIKITRNTYEEPFSEAWNGKNEGDRMSMVEKTTQDYLNAKRLKDVKVFVIGVKSDNQIYIDVEGLPGEREKRAFCRGFEKFLKLNLEPRLEVYLPTALDKMKRDKRDATLARKDPVVSTQTKFTERVISL